MPTVLCAAGVFLLVGCLYIPTFEHPQNASQKDFRDFIGASNSDRPIRIGKINRGGVVALLGEAHLVSTDNSAIGYTVQTKSGYWIWPLCFSGQPADRKMYVLRLQFTADDTLLSYDVAMADIPSDPLFFTLGPNVGQALAKLNRSGPKLYPTGILPR